MIRPANKGDVARMLEIYSPYVTDTAISFEYAPPSLAEFEARFERISARY
ncbi:MAG: GNAT family N-acetyltransferase, partial [Clostridiales bacterium]|nr:GNAT family N-acetyltransferase [Clostridiales bacterium]